MSAHIGVVASPIDTQTTHRIGVLTCIAGNNVNAIKCMLTNADVKPKFKRQGGAATA
jgi:hypothetical protein